MDTPSKYYLQLKTLDDKESTLTYNLDNIFFEKNSEGKLHEGIIEATVKIKKIIGEYRLQFYLKGEINLICDRCLDSMQQLIECEETIYVKFANVDEIKETNDDKLLLPINETGLDIEWYLYECIILHIPYKHVHEDGKCNKEMFKKINMFIVDSENKEEKKINKKTDPRWDVLKNLYNK